MLSGLLLTLYYIVRVEFSASPWLGLQDIGMAPWFNIQSTSAGVFGIAFGFAVTIAASLVTRADPAAEKFLALIRRS